MKGSICRAVIKPREWQMCVYMPVLGGRGGAERRKTFIGMKGKDHISLEQLRLYSNLKEKKLEKGDEGEERR